MNRSGAILMWLVILAIAVPLFAVFGTVVLADRLATVVSKRVKGFWSWRTHHMAGPWVYSINPTTGQRKAVYARDFSGYVPLDWHWLREGDLLVDDAGRRIVVAKTAGGLDMV